MGLFAMRPNRIKNRDLWDIAWLHNRAVPVSEKLLVQKLKDRKIDGDIFRVNYNERLEALRDKQGEFLSEMRRFLSPSAFTPEFTGTLWWEHLLLVLRGFLNIHGI